MRSHHEAGVGITDGILVLMAAASGVAVGNLYYIQPLLADIGRTFAVSAWAMGTVAMLAQLGFATGVLFFVPLGDIRERRQLIVIMLLGAAASLIGVATARSYAWVATAAFFVGAFSVSPQMFVPFAAHLARPEQRGRAVGIVMSGLLIGILLSRTASGYIGSVAGWRSMFWVASALTLGLAVFVAGTLPRSAGTSRLSYPRLLQSLWDLVRREQVLRESALAGAMLFGAFSAFWSMLAFRLETPPLHYGTRVGRAVRPDRCSGSQRGSDRRSSCRSVESSRQCSRGALRSDNRVRRVRIVRSHVMGTGGWSCRARCRRPGRSRDEPIANSQPSARSAQSSDDGVHGGVLSWRCRWFRYRRLRLAEVAMAGCVCGRHRHVSPGSDQTFDARGPSSRGCTHRD